MSDGISIKELQAWYPCTNHRGAIVSEGELYYPTEKGIAATTGSEFRILLDDVVTPIEWNRFDPYNMLIGVDKHDLITFSTAECALTQASKIDKSEPAVLTTHTIKADCVLQDRTQGLFFVQQGELFKWGGGQPMLATYRTSVSVQNGWWRPNTFKIVADYGRKYNAQANKIKRLFEHWQKAHRDQPKEMFFDKLPEYKAFEWELINLNHVKVTFYRDNDEWFKRSVTSAKEHKLPHQGFGVDWAIEIKTYIPVYELHYQTSADDLTQEGGQP
jgi:hypothetical protein